MYKLFLCLRYLLKRRIAFFAVAAVCLCVAMVLIVVSVMGGFLEMVKDRSRGMLGDLVMENRALQGFPYYDEFIATVEADAEMSKRIHEITPVIITYGVMRTPVDGVTNPVQIVGIYLEETYRVNDFELGLYYEKFYPGMTSFEPRGWPRFGKVGGKWRLPEEFEAAWAKAKDEVSASEVQDAMIPDLPIERPGIFFPVPKDFLDDPDPPPGWLGDELPGVILGTDLCAKRNEKGEYERYYPRGERVELTMVPITQEGDLDASTGAPRPMFRYVDDCRTGVFDVDSMSVYVDFDLLQEILDMHQDEYEIQNDDGTWVLKVQPGRTTQIQIKLKPEFTRTHQVEDTKKKLMAVWDRIKVMHIGSFESPVLLDRVNIKTWEEKQAKYINAVRNEKTLVTTLFGVISVVAVFLVGCIFYMIVQQKTRDIGIIKSVGATSFGVAQIFLAYGAAVGFVGGAIGTVVGTLFCVYINEIHDLLGYLGIVVWDPSVYLFDKIPNKVDPFEASVIYVTAIVASVIGSLIAATRAAMVWPVEALRYE